MLLVTDTAQILKTLIKFNQKNKFNLKNKKIFIFQDDNLRIILKIIAIILVLI